MYYRIYNYCNSIKHIIKYKHLSTSAPLKTVNLHIHFSACIQTSIKILSKSYQQNFYIVGRHSRIFLIFKNFFQYVFINKYHIALDIHRNILEIKNATIPPYLASNNEFPTNNVPNNHTENKFYMHHAFLNKEIILGQMNYCFCTINFCRKIIYF